ncbi:unnamed protein product [Mytilus edulis]|uniref:non-specific serine/threonine protein kinase n=1 Tax=Mytilus edulis TaxID=6550 RepID=A0A8S3T676_MYTED|nr:unnamed protein product [Mytilus edulis]
MEPWSIELYLKALKCGSEKRRDITLVIVGKKGAGKTSLVRRLFGEELTNLESTNGIEIHRRQCKIKSDQWTKKADKDSDINKRILESVVEQLYLNEKEQISSESSPGMLDRQNIYPNIAESLDEEEIVNERIEDKVDVIYERIADNNDVIYERIVDKDDVNNDRIESSRQEINISVPVLVQETDQPSNDIMQTSEQMASKELSAISNTDVVLKDEEDFTTLTLWDFAGDEEFYATHQTFLNQDAVYILVANLNDKDKDNANHEHVTFKFWMDTIHCYGCRVDTTEVGPINQATLLNPPVIFVGTHKDELQHENECSMQLECHMDTLCVDTRRHLRKCHLISNKSGGKSEFDKIRKDIFDLATNSITTEKEYPVKFIQLERLLHVEYTSGTRIFSFRKVQELASKISIPITDEEELNLFLRYQNEIGNLVFFRDIPEYIILDPLWLSDAFKCIVTATHFQKELPYFSEWKEVKKTGKISYQLIKEIFKTQEDSIKEHQDHVLAVMEKFDIIINPLGHPNKSSVSSDAESYYYIPCMMQVQKIEEIDKLFKVEDEYKSTCLCFIFNFLPPYLISHLIVSCLRKYSVASVQQQEGLFKDCCVFDVSDCRCIKLLLVKFGNMIELQIWQSNKDKPCQYNEIFNFIEGEINRILTTRYRMTTVSFDKKWKCSLTNYTCENSFEEFGKKKDGETFMCQEHAVNHKYKDDWFCETSKDSDRSSDEQRNFARLSMVVFEILGSVLYDRLDLDKNIGKILQTRVQYDITRLYRELRLLDKSTPSKGWGNGLTVEYVLSSDTCIGDDIERIRLIRNEIQHSGTFALDDARYHILITIIQDMLDRFDQRNNPAGDSYVNRLKEIRKMELKPKDLEDMIARFEKETSTPHQNFADKIEYHYHF